MEQTAVTRLLARVDWDFQDYVSKSYPEDINNMHWYPASFIPQIPSILIQMFSERKDEVLDPFLGSGVALVEAAKQGRNFLGVDSNPYAVDIVKAKFEALNCRDWTWAKEFAKTICNRRLAEEPLQYCRQHGINEEVFRWFHPRTLNELLEIHSCIADDGASSLHLLKKVVFSAILKSCCSQRKHYTYITDGCMPKEFIEVPSKQKYIQHLDLVEEASRKFRKQYEELNSCEWRSLEGDVRVGDARDLGWIVPGTVDLIVTSPPYLGCNDYARSMRLTSLFFREHKIPDVLINEIGARCKRHRETLQDEYLRDVKKSFEECKKALRGGGYFALTFGQGKGRVRKSDVIGHLTDYLIMEIGFSKIFDTLRNIKYHRIRFPGVMNERVIVFQKAME
ncbi:MAG TPA: DNA methyltransferase [Candidatus Bathyarchaeia archaeon]|nr:DNA methyltransferase [Candidatus Bathyarchaeia archaeon]